MRCYSWWGIGALLMLVLASCNGSPVAAPAHITSNRLSVQIDLTTTVAVAGNPIKGVLVVKNPHASINLNHGCRPQFAVTLSNRRFPPDAVFPLPCSIKPFIITHGTNRLPFTVSTGYPGCTQPGGGPITPTSPSCIGGNMIPPLPPGTYQAVFNNFGMSLPTPRPVPVTLTS